MKRIHLFAIVLGMLSSSIAIDAEYDIVDFGYWAISLPIIVIGIVLYNSLKK